MLYWSLTISIGALLLGLLVIAFTAAGSRNSISWPYPRIHWDFANRIPAWLSRIRGGVLAAAWAIRGSRLDKFKWGRMLRHLALCTTVFSAAWAMVGIYY